MAVLGIESSAHTFGVGIVEDGKVLANQTEMFRISDKGIIPAKVSELHMKNAKSVIESALKTSGIKIDQLDAIGYTKGPGMGPCLSIGCLAAKTLAIKNELPIFPVNHAVAHIEIARSMNHFTDPLALYVSGGNSQILALAEKPYRHYHVYGETFDIGIGNMLDSFARRAKLKPAWGSTVAKIAEKGKYIQMPYTVKGMDFTFTGLLTNAVKLIGNAKIEDIAYSLQETSFSMLCEATERALMLLGKREFLVCGGVAQSLRLKEMLGSIAKEHSLKFGVARNEYNADNGAMIALVAEKMMHTKEKYSLKECDINQKYRIDSFVVRWK
jgi:N6-L-threonylcarbamoyladenine synthase